MEEGLDVEECAGYCGQMLELCEKMGRADLARYCHARCVRAVCRARTLLCLLSPPYISLLKLTRCCPVFACRSFYIRLRSECRACPACPAHILICSSVQLQTRSTHSYNRPSQASTGAKQQNTSLCGKYTREQCFTGGKQPSLTNFKLIMSLHLRNCSRKYRDTLTPI